MRLTLKSGALCLLLATETCAILAGCKPVSREAPSKSRSTTPVTKRTPAPPAPPEPLPEPNWVERERYWTTEYSRSFKLPEAGTPVSLSLAQGGMVRGLFDSVTPEGVNLKVGPGSATYPFAILSPASRSTFLAEETVRPQVQQKIEEEKKEFQRQAAERALLMESASVPVGAPVNSPEDGSVWQVKEYVTTHTRSPEAVRYVQWFPVQKYEKGYFVRCHYYADGGSFGQFLEDKVFFMDARGRVVRTSAGTGSL